MSLFGSPESSPGGPPPKFPSKPLFPFKPSERPGFVQKPTLQKPAPKPLFEGGKKVPIRQLIREARKGPVIIPGTGGKLAPRREWTKRLTELLPYAKFKTHLDIWEAKRMLRQLRRQEAKTYNPSLRLKLNRDRRILEQKWGLKGKY